MGSLLGEELLYTVPPPNPQCRPSTTTPLPSLNAVHLPPPPPSSMSSIHSRFPRFAPSHLLDFGSGLGGVVWAANRRWNESLVEHFCDDASPEMRDAAERLMQVDGDREWKDDEIDINDKKKNRFEGEGQGRLRGWG